MILNCKKPTEKNCVSDQTCVVLAWLKRTSRLSPTSSDNWWSGARQTWRRPGQSSGGSPSKTSTQSCSKTRKGATHPWDCCEESNLAPSLTTFCLNGYAGLKPIYLYHSGFVKLPVSALLSSNQYVLLQFGNQRLFYFLQIPVQNHSGSQRRMSLRYAACLSVFCNMGSNLLT